MKEYAITLKLQKIQSNWQLWTLSSPKVFGWPVPDSQGHLWLVSRLCVVSMPSHVTDAIAWEAAWILGAVFPSSHSWWSRSCRPIGTTCKILLDYHLQFLKVCGMSCVFYPHKDFTLQLRGEIEVTAHISAGLKIRWPGFKFFFEFASLRVHSSTLKSMMVSFPDSSV